MDPIATILNNSIDLGVPDRIGSTIFLRAPTACCLPCPEGLECHRYLGGAPSACFCNSPIFRGYSTDLAPIQELCHSPRVLAQPDAEESTSLLWLLIPLFLLAVILAVGVVFYRRRRRVAVTVARNLHVPTMAFPEDGPLVHLARPSMRVIDTAV